MNLDRIVELSRIARRNNTPGSMSTGEAITVALVLNRHDWLTDEGYTIAQALDRIDPDTVQHLRDAERVIQADGQCDEPEVQRHVSALYGGGQ